MAESRPLIERLQFIELDEATCAELRKLKPLLDEEMPRALEVFYQKVRSEPVLAHFFADSAQMTRAKNAQVGHWSNIAEGKFDDRYLKAVTTVGETHARIGLEPRWYVGGYALIVDEVVREMTRRMRPRLALHSRAQAEQLGASIGAFVKAVFLDMDLAISVYIEAAEQARRKEEEARRISEGEREHALGLIEAGLASLAGGDLSARVEGQVAPQFQKIKDDFNHALGRLQSAMLTVNSKADGIRASSHEVSQASDDLSRRTEQQAASLEETAAALDQITATLKRSAEGAREARGTVAQASEEARQSGEVVRGAIGAMTEIEDSSKKISQIIGVIDEIAFQTNLLALNAGVEAARAGEAGKGFAVVAQEVRALAQRSADAAKEIKTLIQTSTSQVAEGVALVGRTGKALDRIIEQVASINTLVSDISSSTAEQSTGLEEVNTAINQMDQVTQQNAAMVEQSTAASQSLAGDAADLSALMAQFQMGDEEGFATAPAPKLRRVS